MNSSFKCVNDSKNDVWLTQRILIVNLMILLNLKECIINIFIKIFIHLIANKIK